jgi:hypothetical protein
LHLKEIQVGSLQAEVVAGLRMEPARLVAQVLAELQAVVLVKAVIHLRQQRIQAVVLAEVLVTGTLQTQLGRNPVLEVQAFFVLRYLQQIIQAQ